MPLNKLKVPWENVRISRTKLNICSGSSTEYAVSLRKQSEIYAKVWSTLIALYHEHYVKITSEMSKQPWHLLQYNNANKSWLFYLFSFSFSGCSAMVNEEKKIFILWESSKVCYY